MKNSDIALVILIAAISFGLSYWIVGAIMKNPSKRVEEISYIQEISETIDEPDHETFNAYAINMNEDGYSGKCGYGTHYNGVTCVKDGTEENTEQNTEQNTEDNTNPEDNTNSDENSEPNEGSNPEGQ
jgi:hypothetical protein